MDVIEDLRSGTPAVTVKDHPAKSVQMYGTLLRHSKNTWIESPYTHQESHKVRTDTPVKSVCYDEKIEHCTPFYQDVYWETKREQCMSCFRADERFRQWACGNSNTPFMN